MLELEQWLTNNGFYHKELEKALAEYLEVEYISLFTNGTLPLITALQALGLRNGEIITTPYSFVATTHSIWWNGLTPVFVDVDPVIGNIDPDKIEAAITEKQLLLCQFMYMEHHVILIEFKKSQKNIALKLFMMRLMHLV